MILRDLSPHIFSEAEVQVLIFKYPEAKSHEEFFKQFLNSEELLQAEKYPLSKPQKNFIIRRGLLKLLLGKLLDLDPHQIEVHFTAAGKPFSPFLQFNYSDSKDYLAFAFSKLHPLGIDIEFIDQQFDYPSIIQEILNPRELAIFQTLSPTQQRLTFFDLWTAKEAYLKYNGQGLTALQNMEYAITAPRKIHLKSTNGQHPHYQTLEFDENYSSALVTANSNSPMIHFLSFVE